MSASAISESPPLQHSHSDFGLHRSSLMKAAKGKGKVCVCVHVGGHSVRPQKIACLPNEVFKVHCWSHAPCGVTLYYLPVPDFIPAHAFLALPYTMHTHILQFLLQGSSTFYVH